MWNVDLNVFSQGLQQALYPYYSYGLFGGKDKPPFLTTPVANSQLTIDVIETRYTRVETGERYDFINKVTSKVYRYDPQRVNLPRADRYYGRAGQVHLLDAGREGSSYEFTVTAKDAQGRSASTRTFAYSFIERGGPSGNFASDRLRRPFAERRPALRRGRQGAGDVQARRRRDAFRRQESLPVLTRRSAG